MISTTLRANGAAGVGSVDTNSGGTLRDMYGLE
jgi:hypothetical protein